MSSSRTNAARAIVAAAIAAVLVLAVVGSGDDVPEGAVAKIGDTAIAKKDFDRLYATEHRDRFRRALAAS